MKRVVIIGIGGASCSGKTLLAKHLCRALSSATIIHQDDFAPPIEQVPYSSKYPELQDWDDPPTCIVWPDFRRTLRRIRQEGQLPEGYESNDHLNKQIEVDIDNGVFKHWQEQFKSLERDLAAQGEQLIWFMVDGFVLFWDPETTSYLDASILLRIPHDVLRERREQRRTYALQNSGDAAAGMEWTDPPQYFDKIVYPAYVKAHQHIFQGDVETGTLAPEWQGLDVIEPSAGSTGMTRAFEQAAECIMRGVRAGKGNLLDEPRA